jgi:YgiT-type zinc finger domain-containing protein
MNRPDPTPSACVVCKTGAVKPGETTVTLNRGDTTVTFRRVPANVCDTRGEAYLDNAIAKRLETILTTAIAEGVKYEARDYIAKAVA